MESALVPVSWMPLTLERTYYFSPFLDSQFRRVYCEDKSVSLGLAKQVWIQEEEGNNSLVAGHWNPSVQAIRCRTTFRKSNVFAGNV